MLRPSIKDISAFSTITNALLCQPTPTMLHITEQTTRSHQGKFGSGVGELGEGNMGGGVGFTFSLPRSHPAPQTPTIPAPPDHPHHRIRSWPRLRSPHSHPHGSRSVGWQTISELSDVHYHLLILCLKQLSDCSVFIAPPSSISKYSASSLYHRHSGSIECWKGNLI